MSLEGRGDMLMHSCDAVGCIVSSPVLTLFARYYDKHVCLSVCLPACVYLDNH